MKIQLNRRDINKHIIYTFTCVYTGIHFKYIYVSRNVYSLSVNEALFRFTYPSKYSVIICTNHKSLEATYLL